MIFDLTQELDRQSFVTKSNHLLRKGARVELVVKTRRTRAQNSYLHLILGWFAVETGNTLDYVKREYFKRLVNPGIFAVEKEDPFLGKVTVLKSSKDLTTEEMSKAIERFRNWSSAEGGIYLPSANEQQLLEEIERELSRYGNEIYY